jgi:hypothetical protein
MERLLLVFRGEATTLVLKGPSDEALGEGGAEGGREGAGWG